MTLAKASSELVSISTKDSAACTRVLTRLKSEVLPVASTEESFELFNESVVTTLLAIINDELAFITIEGHRESSVDILRGLLQRAFGQHKTYDEAKAFGILQSLFQQCSHLFVRRMSRHDSSDNRGFHGTSMEPLEQSEHIRLSLVELMSELGSYMIIHTNNVAMESIIIEATAYICQTLAKHVFNDSYPDILTASCTLAQTLAKLSPAAIEKNATDLLLQLVGNLFRNRRSKIRREAVETSCAIILCCQAGDTTSQSVEYESLHSILLQGWEELIKMDTSVSVRVTVLNAVGMVAKQFDWKYSHSEEHTGKDIHQSMELTSFVESNVLSLLVLGASDGNTQAQESAIQQMISTLNFGSHRRQESSVPWDVISRYFQPVLELILASCSLSSSTCEGRVRSLEALQVFLSFAITILDNSVMANDPCLTLLPRMQAIVECLRMSILSEEKDVLQVGNDLA